MSRPRLRVPALYLARLVACSLILVVSGGAAAAPPADRSRESFDPEDFAVRETYRKAITSGVAEYDAGHFEEALSYFRRAHQLSPNARTLRGMGKAYFELRDYVAAVRNLTAALKDQRKPLSDDQRDEVQDLIDRSRLFVAIYTLRPSPSDAQVLIDGNVPEVQPDGTIMVGLGEHTIEARAKGYQRLSMPLRVRGGERKVLSLALEPMAPPEADGTQARADASHGDGKSADAQPDGASNLAAVSWLVGSGVAALLAGGAGIYWGVQSSNLSKCRYPASGPMCTNESQIVRQKNLGVAVTIGAGAVAVTAAIIGILSWNSAPDQPTQTSFSCGVGPFGVACGGVF